MVRGSFIVSLFSIRGRQIANEWVQCIVNFACLHHVHGTRGGGGGGWKKIRAWKKVLRAVPPSGGCLRKKSCRIQLVAFGFLFSQGTDFVRQFSGAFYTTPPPPLSKLQ